jgi:hypothetical protein
MWKILALCLALGALAVALPTYVLASSEQTAPAPAGPQVAGGQHPTRGWLHTGSWTTTEPYASLLAQSGSSGSDLQLSTLGPYLFQDYMESGTGSWTTTGTWGITTEYQPSWEEPGNHSWSDSPGGNYANSTNTALTSGVIDLSAAAPDQYVSLMLDCSYDLQEGYDFLYVDFSNNGGSTWVCYGDSLTGFQTEGRMYASVPSEMLTNQFKFRLRLQTDASGTADGVHIDNVSLYADGTDWTGATDPRLVYSGSWTSATRYFPDSGGGTWTYKSSSTPGDLVQIAFTGPAIAVEGKGGPNCGIASVSVDGGPATEADYYIDPSWGFPYYSYPTGVYFIDGLTDAPHTLTICCTGTKNPASTGYAVSVEGLYVWGTPTQATAPPRYQQENTYLEYTGTWGTSYSWSVSGGSLVTADSPGAAANVTFDGTYLALIAKKGPGYGKAQVSLDGGTPVLVDFYKSYDSNKQRVYSTGLLTPGSHTLSIYWTGQKNAAAWGTKIDLDALDVLGTLTDAPAPPPILWRYQQSDARITYLGGWTYSPTWSASGGSLVSTAVGGAGALVNFTGTEVKLYAKTAPWYGVAMVTLDGSSEMVDLYSATQLYKQAVYSKTGLSPGAHTLSIQCSGAKRLASSGYSVDLDALDINGYLTQAPRATRIQDTASSYYFWQGTWSTISSSWLYSGGDFTSTSTSGAKVTVAFNGTYLSWLAKTAPWYGKARVTLDGDTVNAVTVDLYSAATGYKKPVYNTGLLADTSHTLLIEWTGLKNTRASGTTIGVDAFDIVFSTP